MQRRLYIDEAHTALDIFRFAEFFLAILKLMIDSNLNDMSKLAPAAMEVYKISKIL